MAQEIIQPLDKSPGIYFDRVSTLKLVNDHVYFIIPVDINYVKPHLENINDIMNTAKSLCKQNELTNDFQCQYMIQPLMSLYDDILRNYDAISHLISPRSKRSAWFAGIGSLMKTVFGTMDDDDSEKYENAIQTLQSDNKKLASLIKQSIFISNSAITNFNETLNTISRNEARMNDVINSLAISINNVTLATNELLIKNKIIEISNVLYSSLLTMSFKLEDIVNSILFANSNTLHPSVVTPRQLYEDLNRNVRHLPKYKEFPVSIELGNINFLLRVSELAAYYSYNKVVFILGIPLVHHMDYDLYRILPVPIPHGAESPNSFAMIIPTKNLVALSKDKSTYCTLDNLNSCKPIYKGTLACDVSDILSVNSNPICEIELMTKIVKVLPSQCETKLVYGKIDIWQKLSLNNWIFVQSQSTKLTIECNANIKETIINGTGILSLEPHCMAFCGNVKLLAMQNLEENMTHVTSDFNLINDKCCDLSRVKKLKMNTSAVTISNVNLESLKHLKNLADQENNDIDRFMNKSNSFSNHISFPILTIILIIAFISFLVYLCCKANGYNIKFPRSRPNALNDEEEPQAGSVPLPRLRIT